MNKSELIASVADKTGMTKKASKEVIEAIFGSVTKELSKGGKFQLIGFGTFKVRALKARKGRNPQSGKPIQIAASKRPVFTAGKELKEVVNGKKRNKK